MNFRYFSEADVDRLLDMPAAIDAMQGAFRALAAGAAENVPRRRAAARGIVLHSMSAAANYLGLVGWKQYTTTRHGAKFQVGIYDQASGELVALISADRLGQLRTGAATGLAVRQLAAPDADQLGLIGTGWQAESQLAAVAAARPLRQVFVYGRDETRRVQFAAKMAEQLGLDVQPAATAQEAVSDQPIVVTATSSRTPVLEGEWLAEDALVCAIGSNWLNKSELDLNAVRRAARVVCDSVDACRLEAGDLVAALDAGILQWSDVVELQDLVDAPTHHRPGITLFKSVGLAIEDVALASVLLERAEANGVGQPVNLEESIDAE